MEKSNFLSSPIISSHLNSMDITAVCVKVIQEQQNAIAALSAKVKMLEDKIQNIQHEEERRCLLIY
ncbi:hypothetical protein KsCSTR_44870 [Candidatus Kuenenia stuttgartiensis]|uniref:Uncharacterized protein n=1 Tax=Kuenenia stuttgartiensis TaxID=174633 RepID=Q1PWP4_KUEST|nr:hypothetical protein [uncultured Candidatus Kuenenia sp.]QII13866.1 hypothetical protein KsCSTR_44870 [Candidatus Kuenenia stuttgartiensis]GJQ47690.1 MAG: hypothetical protein HKUEN01_00760 [Candidatus Kuenenia stuttgartiensis]CAJ71646.1 Unknown Protein [Candidatus Kuenenia stuttgartiensis]SOH05020.1 hypothetical protein KSMBR1_2533 [Candidatus Kuenenia stuttgartiensis]